MTVEELSVKVEMYPDSECGDGSVVLLGNSSKRRWIDEGVTATMTRCVFCITEFDRLGIHTKVKPIKADYGDDSVVARRGIGGSMYLDTTHSTDSGEDGYGH